MVLPNPVMLQKDKREEEEEEAISHKCLEKKSPNPVISNPRDHVPRESAGPVQPEELSWR